MPAEKDIQFGCYMTPEEAKQLNDYAEGMEISRPKLCILLVVRELRCDRLAGLSRVDNSPLPKKESKRVSARAISPAIKAEFTKHAIAHGLGTDEAAAILFRTELAERWLEHCLCIGGNRP